ncbi:hypothetical protein AB0M22_19070 [Nocardia sp. NPDC051756]|uniref:hypothetical protein n=1 Tax=Nocardia sp. NPDC051756 TaxID=3154751 RepID=UPI00344AC5BB
MNRAVLQQVPSVVWSVAGIIRPSDLLSALALRRQWVNPLLRWLVPVPLPMSPLFLLGCPLRLLILPRPANQALLLPIRSGLQAALWAECLRALLLSLLSSLPNPLPVSTPRWLGVNPSLRRLVPVPLSPLSTVTPRGPKGSLHLYLPQLPIRSRLLRPSRCLRVNLPSIPVRRLPGPCCW